MRLEVWAAGALLRLLGATWRLEWEGLEHLEAARRASPRGNVIFALWHSSLAILAYTHRGREIQVLVSQHRDGELIARVIAGMGYGLARGSSRRGGVEALFRLATLLEAGKDVAVTVDGPLGPRHSVHPGVILLARRTGSPIVPVVPSAARVRCLPTWDALRLPDAWTRVRVHYCAPVQVAAKLPEDGVSKQCRALQETLGRAALAAEARHGRRLDLEDVQDRRGFWERAGEAESPAAWLRCLGAAHGAGLRVERNLRPRRAGRGGRPWVIGVGNLEAGGTGKTPCVIELFGALQSAGLQVAVLTRGHRGILGRSAPQRLCGEDLPLAADETRLLAAALGPDSTIVVSRDKRRGLESLRSLAGLDVVLVDDAFQTVGLEVDRHLVLLDWERPFGNGRLLPAGRLREPPGALRRAAALLFTRAGGGPPPQRPAWAHLPEELCFVAHERPTKLVSLAGRRLDPETLRGRGVALLSGLGRPQAFEHLARQLAARHGFQVRRAVRVGDHAPVEPELRKLVGRLEALECSHVLLTRKDAFRLPVASEWDEPLLVLEQRLVVPALLRLLEALLPGPYLASAKLAKLTDNEA